VTEDIITELSRFPTLFVIARNSTFSYKGKAQDLKKVARGHCQRKNNYLPARQIDISPPLISHGFFRSIQADPHHLKYLEFSSDNAASWALS
jgi:hypothetical protein